MVLNSHHDGQNRQNDVGSRVMSRPGLARPICRAHQESEIACGGLDQKLLAHILLASNVQPVQSAGIKLMREVPLDPFSPPALQPLASIPLRSEEHTSELQSQSNLVC